MKASAELAAGKTTDFKGRVVSSDLHLKQRHLVGWEGKRRVQEFASGEVHDEITWGHSPTRRSTPISNWDFYSVCFVAVSMDSKGDVHYAFMHIFCTSFA